MKNVTSKALEPGTIFLGRYEVLRCIKEGGMGAVYEVLHLETRRRRALKVMLPSVVGDADLRSRFRLEATITADIETEHIVETFDAGVDPATGAPFLVMELLKGEDLDALLRSRGPLSPALAVVILGQVASALDKTHAAGIVHRDLKPENLFVTWREDGSPRIKVLDFGIAKIVAESTQAKATRSMGSPLYMSPEQLKGDGRIGPRADVYAVGHVTYTALVGRPYWEDDFTDQGVWPLLLKMMDGAREAATVRAAKHGVMLPPAFDAWFRRATALDASDRFETAIEMVKALGDALGVPQPRLSFVGGEAVAEMWVAGGAPVAAVTSVAPKVTLASRPEDPAGATPVPDAEAGAREPGGSARVLDQELSTPSSTLAANGGLMVGQPRPAPPTRLIGGALALVVIIATAVYYAQRGAQEAATLAAPSAAVVHSTRAEAAAPTPESQPTVTLAATVDPAPPPSASALAATAQPSVAVSASTSNPGSAASGASTPASPAQSARRPVAKPPPRHPGLY